MRFDELPLRHPRDILLQEACQSIRRTLLGMDFKYSDFVAAFLSCGPRSTAESDSIRNVFDAMATDLELTPGEKVMIIGDLLHQIGWRVIAHEATLVTQ